MKTTAGSSGLNFWGLGVLLTFSRFLHLKTRRLRAKQKESGRDPLQDLRVLDKDKNKTKPPDCSVVSRRWAGMRTITRKRARLKPSVLFLLQSQLLRLDEFFCKILLFGRNEIKNRCNVCSCSLNFWGLTRPFSTLCFLARMARIKNQCTGSCSSLSCFERTNID